MLFRLTDVELNKLKGDSVARISETPAKIPILIVVRSLGTGKQEALEGLEIIAPTGFGKYFLNLVIFSLGRDLWIAAQLRTAHASGLYDDLSAHFESGALAFPADYLDTSAGISEVARMQKESEVSLAIVYLPKSFRINIYVGLIIVEFYIGRKIQSNFLLHLNYHN